MQGDAEQPPACTSESAGVTGKMLRGALIARPAPDGFRESLLRNLVEGRLDPLVVERSRAARSRRSADQSPRLG